tara:strand:- start:1744 stop:2133 length:390 start_codon:yes stop_codon:yes gene_type:complete
MALVIMIGEAKKKPSTTKGKKMNRNYGKKKKTGMNVGGQLKKPNPSQAGLKKLPESVRNKMGFMATGGMPKKKTGMMYGGMMPAKKKTSMMGGGMMPKKKRTAMMGGGMTDYRKKGMFYGGMTKKGKKK